MKNKKEDYQENNELEKEISDHKEWQQNQYNPGHYIGTGRVPKPMASLNKYPVILIIIGVIWLIVGIMYFIFQEKGIGDVFFLLISWIMPWILIYGGVVRLISKKRKRK